VKKRNSRRRDYGSIVRRRRRTLEHLVAAGHVTCARCGLPIIPEEAWVVSQSDELTSPQAEHRGCSRVTDAQALRTSRDW
jgi:hypothetical protein